MLYFYFYLGRHYAILRPRWISGSKKSFSWKSCDEWQWLRAICVRTCSKPVRPVCAQVGPWHQEPNSILMCSISQEIQPLDAVSSRIGTAGILLLIFPNWWKKTANEKLSPKHTSNSKWAIKKNCSIQFLFMHVSLLITVRHACSSKVNRFGLA